MDHNKESNIKRPKKSNKEKKTFDKYGKNTQKGLRIKGDKYSDAISSRKLIEQ
jgi:hypothetical protein